MSDTANLCYVNRTVPISALLSATFHLSSDKAPGSDAIPADIYKAGGQPMAEKLTELFHSSLPLAGRQYQV